MKSEFLPLGWGGLQSGEKNPDDGLQFSPSYPEGKGWAVPGAWVLSHGGIRKCG